MTNHHEYIILGAGPAGVQLGYYFEKTGRDYLILERGERAGAFFDVYPRHRTLISINKRHTGSDDPEFNMRHDWNSLLSDDNSLLFGNYDDRFFPGADNLVRYINDYVNQHQIKIKSGVQIDQISRQDGIFQLKAADGMVHTCRYLIIATGLSRAVKPEIPGIELAECYSKMSVNKADYTNQRVLIIGKGNSAFETADHLVDSAAMIHVASPESIVMAWKSHYVGHLRAVNNNFLDTYQLKSQNAVLDAEICGIRQEGDMLRVTFKYEHAQGEVEEICYHKVLYCAGFKFDSSVFDASAAPALTACGKFPAITWEYESVSQPRMYFAGTITHSLDYRKSTSGFIHGFRYNSRALGRMLGAKYHDQPWPMEMLELSPETLCQTALGRVNRSSALWQQPGYMMDVLAVEGGQLKHFREMPEGYARTFADVRFDTYFTVSLEYGDPIVGDPFNVDRVHRENVDQARRSQFLHPVVRYFAKGECVEEHHVLEDLEAVWVEQEHTVPLTAFFDMALKGELKMMDKMMEKKMAMDAMAADHSMGDLPMGGKEMAEME